MSVQPHPAAAQAAASSGPSAAWAYPRVAALVVQQDRFAIFDVATADCPELGYGVNLDVQISGQVFVDDVLTRTEAEWHQLPADGKLGLMFAALQALKQQLVTESLFGFEAPGQPQLLCLSAVVYGPQGCGKTNASRSVAQRLRLPTILEEIAEDWGPGQPLPISCLAEMQVDKAELEVLA